MPNAGPFTAYPLAGSALLSPSLLILGRLATGETDTAPALADDLAIHRMHVFRLLVELEKRSFVMRSGNGRATRWSITSAGIAEIRDTRRQIDYILNNANLSGV